MSGDEETKSGGDFELSLATTAGGPPPGATQFGRRRRTRGAIRWGSMGLFAVSTLIIGAHLLWAATHTRPDFSLTPELEFAETGIFDLSDLGLESPHRIADVHGIAVSTLAEYAAAIDNHEGPFLRFRAVDTADPSAERQFAYRNVPKYPIVEINNDREILTIDGIDLETLDLPSGMRLIAVEGEEITSPEDLSRIMQSDLGRIVRLSLEAPSGSGPQFEFIFNLLPWNVSYTLFLTGLMFGALGCTVFWLKPDTRSSWGFLFFCLHVGLLWLLRSIPKDYALLVERAPYFILLCFLPLATVGFLLTFSPIRLALRRTSRYVVAAALFGIGLILLEAMLNPELLTKPALGDVTLALMALSTMLLAVITLPVDFWFRWRKIPLGATDRARARVIRLATLFGFVPVNLYTLYWLQSDASTTAATNTTRVVFELSVLLFPAIIGYAIVRYNLLRVDELIHESFVYLLLLSGLGAAFMAISGGAVPLIDALAPGASGFIQPVLIGGVSLAALPAHQRLRTIVAKRFRRAGIDPEVVDQAIQDASTSTSSQYDFVEQLVRSLGDITSAKNVIALMYHPGREVWSMGASASPVDADELLQRCGPLLDSLRSKHRPIFRDTIIDRLESAGVRWSILEAVTALQAAVVYPLIAQGRLLGALAIGDRRSGRNYTSEELAALGSAARQSAVLISKLVAHQVSGRQARIVDLYPDYPAAIAQYEILDFIGEGGMSYVYHGRHEGQEYAIKLANRAVQSDAALRKRFQREAQAMQILNHPNIARIAEVGADGDEPFIAMEYFKQGSLDDYLKRTRKLDEGAAIDFILQAANGLNAALGQNIIHRDIKPKNLFIDEEGVLKVGDFGLARLIGEETITLSGQIFGTPQYMAPELYRGERGTRASDEYALGIAFYEILTRQRPYGGESMEALVYAQLHRPVPDVRRARKDVSEDTAHVVKRMMAKNPKERFESYEELVHDLEAILRSLQSK